MATEDKTGEDLTELFAALSVNKGKTNVHITRSLVGSYNWKSKGKLYIPGYPAALRPNFMHLRVGKLNDGDAPPEVGHSNEHMHNVYFEPVQEVLSFAGKKLEDYKIITDRNNLRKLDDAIQGGQDYPNFLIYARKINGILILKREDLGRPTTLAGHDFESELTIWNGCESAHVLVECDTSYNDQPPIKLLIRGEIDACDPRTPVKRVQDYSKAKTTETGLEVYTCNAPPPTIDRLREIKMARELKEFHHYQSWLLGVPAVVHGIARRTETKTITFPKFESRFADIVDALQQYSARMEEGKTYKFSRKDGNPLEFTVSSHPREWLNMPAGAGEKGK